MKLTIPQFALRMSHNRRGVTLAEVLISMAILTIGLLGAAAMFPVGSYYMQKGEIADRGAAIAQAAFADLVARGDLNPDNWLVWQGANKNQSMGQSMRNWMASATNSGMNAQDYQTGLNNAAGFVYVIDPLGVASAASDGLNASSALMAPFGADVYAGEVVGPSSRPSEDWREFSGAWPVRRLNTAGALVAGRPNVAAANSIYKSGDDLTFVPSEQDGATTQWLVGPDANLDDKPDVALARRSNGNYSWMAMVSPTQSDARQALALDPAAHYYDVTVVVFFKRPLNDLALSERLVGAQVLSTGTGGGDMLLTQLSSDTSSEPFSDLRSGQWIMVSGPHPASTPVKPLFFTQWYKVLAVDETPRGGAFTSELQQRLVGLRGPDWPWQPNAQIRVGIFPGAVAVHTKTMRLESLGEYQR